MRQGELTNGEVRWVTLRVPICYVWV